MDGLTHLGAAELARLIRAGDTSPLDVVEAHIARIEEIEPSINAFITTTFDEARDHARRLTQNGVPSDAPPLHGVPVTIKDALAVGGVRFTAGSYFRRDDAASADAESVRRLKAAGAIVLGKTSCPDMSGSAETRNPINGQTHNPWNLEHSPGGSSGGEGAIIGAGGSPLGLGADIAGSVRLPAAFCGVPGLKPTARRISTAGHVPETPTAIEGWNTVGPLARRVEDLQLALELLSETPTTPSAEIHLHGRRLVLPPALAQPPTDADVWAAVEKSAAILIAAGMVHGGSGDLPLTGALYETSAVMHREWLSAHQAGLGGGRPVSLWREMFAALRGRSHISTNCLATVASLTLVGPALRVAGYGRPGGLEAVRRQFLDEMKEGALLLWPVFHTTAPRHGFSRRPSGSPAYTSIFNGLGFPAVAFPVGFDAKGLPLSVQIIARPGEDEVALAAAAVLERELGGWQSA